MITVKLRYLEQDGTVLKLRDIRVFEKSRVKYFINKWLELTHHYGISIVFELHVSVFEISTFNSIYIYTVELILTNSYQNINMIQLINMIKRIEHILHTRK